MGVVVTTPDGKKKRYENATKFFSSPDGVLSVVDMTRVLAVYRHWSYAELEGAK